MYKRTKRESKSFVIRLVSFLKGTWESESMIYLVTPDTTSREEDTAAANRTRPSRAKVTRMETKIHPKILCMSDSNMKNVVGEPYRVKLSKSLNNEHNSRHIVIDKNTFRCHRPTNPGKPMDS